METGTPASRILSQARADSDVSSRGWLNCVMTHSGRFLLRTLQREAVILMGITEGTRLPMRSTSTWGTDLKDLRRWSMTSSWRIRGSPPERMTSRMFLSDATYFTRAWILPGEREKAG